MQHSVTSNAADHSASSVKTSALAQIFGAIVLGFVLLYGVGFANMDVAHNAAHDTRHAIAFPCH